MIILFLINLTTGQVTTEHFKSYDACSHAVEAVNSVSPGTFTAACVPERYKAPRTGYLGM